MPQYTFRGALGTSFGETTVSAPDERAARKSAMFARWGAPKPLRRPIPETNPPRYHTIGNDGFGLDLIKVSP